MTSLTSLEICAGAGGQALGLERAGFDHVAAVEIEAIACETLRLNRPTWNVLNTDARNVSGRDYRGVDLFAGGVPCPPFSVAGKQLGEDDNRDLFPVALRMIQDAKPTAVLLENVPGLATARFAPYRDTIRSTLEKLGYEVFWQTLYASQFGVPQLRPRVVLVGIKGRAAKRFQWPEPLSLQRTVGESLVDLMAARGWAGAEPWALLANGIGPTLVGGSKLHGGPDLGPTRAKAAWRLLSVNGGGLADFAPDESVDVDHVPKLTVRMAARIQGFPDEWKLAGRKTAAYRQVGNAFPPPVATAVGAAIRKAIEGVRSSNEVQAEMSMRSA